MEDSDQPPNANESYRTVKDDIWLLERHTGNGWSVVAASYPDTGHGGELCLRATLTHSAGHTIECRPIDPWGHTPGPELLRAHRIRLDDTVRDETIYYAFGEPPERRDKQERVYTVPQSKVSSTDEMIERCGLSGGKGTTAKSPATAKCCILAAARDISARYRKRSQWFDPESTKSTSASKST